ncbi:retention module-containing protein [Parashewanella spongiae]|nr:retention module-containing protein [Parashewanella spongiae]
MDRYTALQEGTFTTVSGQVFVKIGDIEYQAGENEYLPQGASIRVANGARFQIQFKDGQVYSNSNLEDNNTHLIELNALTDIQTLQDIIAAGGDPTIDLPETAAGGAPANEGGSGFTTLERDGAETIATTQFETNGALATALGATSEQVESILDLAPVISGVDFTGESTEAGVDINNAPVAGTLSVSGQMTAVDDIDENLTWSVVGGSNPHGDFSIDASTGAWVFIINNDAEIVQSLQTGESEQLIYTVQVTDSNGGIDTQVVTITVVGTNDAPTITSEIFNASVTESGVDESNTPVDGVLNIGGQLIASDVDNLGSDLSWSLQSQSQPEGTFTVDATTGEWNFALNNQDPRVQALQDGESFDVTYTVRVSDGLGGFDEQVVTITINGTNDAAIVSSANVEVDETNAPIELSGTLTATDVDNPDDTFISQSVVGQYGTFTLDANGNWSFTANSAFDELNVGDNVTETFPVQSIDGTPSQVTITINGTNDAAIVSSANVEVDETNAPIELSGTLTATDVDNPDDTFISQSVVGQYGTFTLDANGNWSFTANSAFDELNVGDNVTETFPVQSIDGTPSQVTITINGTNDAAIVSSANVEVDETNAPIELSGTLTATDVDNPDDTFISQSVVGQYGTFTLDANGNWSFTANSAFDELNVGDNVTETFPVQSIDGTPSQVTITINGTNDAAIVSSANVEVDETNAPIELSGTLTATDVDNPDDTFISQSVVGQYGTFTLDANGNWSFTANSAFDELNVGDNVTETFPVQSIDGTPSQVTITINGTNDAAIVSSANVEVDETNAPIELSGTLTATDVDNPDDTFISQSVVGQYGTFTLDANGNWSFTANSAFDELNVGDNVTETFPVQSIDGTPSQVTITINGTNDAAIVSSANVEVDETNAPIELSGTLTATDVDNPDDTFISQSVVGQYGTFTLDANGNWSFTANSAFDELNVGDNVTETFPVQSIDGTPSQVTITINGTNDAAIVSSANVEVDETNAPIELSGTLTATDVDNPDDTFISQSVVGQYGTFTLDANGNWSFTANSAFDELNVGDNVTETFPVQSIDGTPSQVTITINGTNDAAIVSSANVEVDETNAPIELSGTLTATDVDNPDDTFISQSVVGQYGTFTLDANGNWSFTANSAFDELNVGDNVTETFPVQSIDGTPSQVTITINGTDDIPTLVADTGSVTEDTDVTQSGMLEDSGTLTPGVGGDAGEDKFLPGNFTGLYGTLTLDADGNWVYSADNSQSVIQLLGVGDHLTDVFTVFNADGVTSTTVTITINGTDDVPTLVADAGSVTEDTDVTQSGMLEDSGTLTPGVGGDAGEDKFLPGNFTGLYGTLTLDADGNWVYSADNSQSVIQLLGVGDHLTDVFTVFNADGVTSTTVTITINGTDDAPTLVADTGSVTEDTDVTQSGMLEDSGTLTPGTGGDAGEDKFLPGNFTGLYGTLTLDADGNWVYNADNSQSVIQLLGVGDHLTDVFTVFNADGVTSTTVTITINGTDDVPTLVADAGSVTEDTDVTQSGMLEDSGTLTPGVGGDAGEDKFLPGNFTGLYGTLTLDADGNWVYSADNSQSVIQLLGVGDHLTDVFTVFNADGVTSTTVTITINGTDDVPTLVADTGSVTEDTDVTQSGMLEDSGTLIPGTGGDAGEDKFLPGNFTGLYGTLTLDADGNWVYSADNSQSVIQLLGVGDHLTDVFTVFNADGVTSTTVTITINGTDDAPTLVADTGSVTEDVDVTQSGMLEDSGTLTPGVGGDAGEDKFLPGNFTGLYGTLTLDADGNWVYSADNSQSVIQLLGVGDHLTDVFTVFNADGVTSTTVTITINGTDDVPTLVADAGSVTEDTDVTQSGMLEDSGTLTPGVGGDAGEDKFLPGNFTGLYGTLTLDADGNWVYSADNSQSVIQLLGVGDHLTDVFTVFNADGVTSTTVTITINGTDDVPTLVADTGSVTEDTDVTQSGMLKDSGTLTPGVGGDAGEDKFLPGNFTGLYGTLTLDADGNWVYSADNSQSVIQLLGVGDHLTDVFTVFNADGVTSTTVTITINGTDDAPTLVADTGSVTEDTDVTQSGMLEDSGTLTPGTGGDAGEDKFLPGNFTGLYGTLTLDADGNWVYNADNSQSVIQLLGVGDHLTDVFTVFNADGVTSTTVTITINGTDDVPTLVADAGSVTEDTDVTQSGMLEDSGTLTPGVGGDAGEDKFLPGNFTGLYGTLTLDADGNWVYSADNSQSVIQLLGVGDHLTDVFTVFNADGVTSTTVTITINGTDDVPTLVADTGSVTEDTDVTQSGMLKDSGTLTPGVGGDAGEDKFLPGNFTGLYGTLTLDADGNWVYSADNSQSVIQLLGVGDHLTDVFTVFNADGVTSTTVTITINGTDDVPTLVADTGSVTEDVDVTQSGMLEDSGTLTPGVGGDAGEDKFLPGNFTGLYGTLTLDADGNWVYNADNSQSVIQLLGVGDHLTDVFTVFNADGVTSTTVTITINGTDDVPTLVADTGSVTEDTDVTQSGMLEDSGTLIPGTGGDAGEDKFLPGNFTGLYGTLTLDADGNWVYSADNSQSVIQLLGVGDHLTDVFTVFNADGVTSTTVTITINGTNDAPHAEDDCVEMTESDIAYNTAYVVDSRGNLALVNLSTGAHTKIADTGTIFTDVAISESGELFGITFEGLYIIDKLSGEVTTINEPLDARANALTFSDDGRLYAAGGGTIYELDPTDGSVLHTYDNLGVLSDGDLAFHNGNMYWTTYDGALYEVVINETTGNATATEVISDLGLTTGNYGLVSGHDGNLYVFSGNTVLLVDPINGTTEIVYNYDGAGSALGATIPAAVDNEATGNVLNNDTDIDNNHSSLTVTGIEFNGMPFTVGDVISGTYGFLQLQSNGEFVYRLDESRDVTQDLAEGELAYDVFTYTISDGSGGSDTATLTIKITGTDSDYPANAADDNYTMDEDTSQTLDLLANDAAADGGLSITSIAGVVLTGNAQTIAVANGIVSIASDSTMSFIPNANYNGDVTFDYTITDIDGDTDSATVVIQVMPVVDPIVITPTNTLVSEEALAGLGVIDGIEDSNDSVSDTGSITIQNNDELPLVVSLVGPLGITSNQQAVQWNWEQATGVLTGYIGSIGDNSYQSILTIQLFEPSTSDSDEWTYDVTLIGTIDHPDVESEDIKDILFGINVSDDQGNNLANENFTVNVEDDAVYAETVINEFNLVVDSFTASGVEANWLPQNDHHHTVIYFDGSDLPNEGGTDNDSGNDQIRWGTPHTSSDNGYQSGYGFIDNDIGLGGEIAVNQEIVLGTFTHYNYPQNTGTSITSATMNITFTLTDASGNQTPVSMDIDFDHNETPNTGGVGDDIITIGQTTVTFNYEGQFYTIQVQGFREVGGDGESVTTIYTPENDSTSYELVVFIVPGVGFVPPMTTGTVIDSNVTGADQGFELISVSNETGNVAIVNGSAQIVGLYGTLLIDSNGGYTYTLNTHATDDLEGQTDVFSYMIEDADGDSTTADLIIDLNLVNNDQLNTLTTIEDAEDISTEQASVLSVNELLQVDYQAMPEYYSNNNYSNTSAESVNEIESEQQLVLTNVNNLTQYVGSDTADAGIINHLFDINSQSGAIVETEQGGLNLQTPTQTLNEIYNHDAFKSGELMP